MPAQVEELIESGGVKLSDVAPKNINLDEGPPSEIKEHLDKVEQEDTTKPKVAPDEKPFNPDEFKKAKGEILEVKEPPKKKDETEPEQKKEDKEPEKKSEEGTQRDEGTEEQLPVTAKPIRPKPKLEEQLKEEDLTGLSDSEIGILKKMDKSAREYVKGLIRKNKEAENLKLQDPNRIPERWADHPEAYTLSNQYREHVTKAQRAEYFKSYFEEQFKKVRNGDKWRSLVIDKEGKLVQTEELEPNAEAETYLLNQINLENSSYRESLGIIENIKKDFGVMRSRNVQAVKAIEDKFFPQYQEEKEFQERKEVKDFRETLKKMGQEDNPVSNFLTKLYIWGMEVFGRNQELEAMLNGKQDSNKTKQKTGPSSSEISEGGKGAPSDPLERPFDPNEFKKYKAGI